MAPLMEEAPLQRTLKVGQVTVGLIGLDVALTRVLGQPGLALATAVDQVYAEVSRLNYIPATAVGAYHEALAREIGRLRGGEERESGPLEVRVLGTGCVSCNNLERLMIEIVADRKLAADVFQVHDRDEIGRFGVLQTPALVINGRVRCIGRLPTRAEIEEWLREA